LSMSGEHAHPVRNLNVAWLEQRGSWTIIVSLLVLVRFVLAAFHPAISKEVAWNLWHAAHCVLSFILLHWIRGSLYEGGSGKYTNQTFWEQIDDERQNTPNRKFFIILPLIGYLITLNYSTQFNSRLIATLVLLLDEVPKLSSMHKVRLFGLD